MKTIFRTGRNYADRNSKYAVSVVGPKEAEGPFGALFDEIDDGNQIGNRQLQKRAVKKVIEVNLLEADSLCTGDLLGQCIASSFGISELNCPTIGMYGVSQTQVLCL